MPIENCDYYVYLVPLPVGVHALVSDNGDTTFSIYLNDREDFDHNLDGWEHEIWHILHDDFYGDKDITDIEPQYFA